jgi:hypothetical protein
VLVRKLPALELVPQEPEAQEVQLELAPQELQLRKRELE